MIDKLIKKHYNIDVSNYVKLGVGAGSNTYHVKATDGNEFILKNANINEANNPQNEPKICEHLLNKEIPVSEFVPDMQGSYLWCDGDDVYHMQKFISGTSYDVHCAPNWLMVKMPQILGRIHAALRDYNDLPIGIGENFFKYMTPQSAMISYRKSFEYIVANGYTDLGDDLQYRIKLMSCFDIPKIDLSKLTRTATHGDFFISQLICKDVEIAGVVDWTTACVHPIVWEIIRSFVYGSQASKDGIIVISDFIEYTKNYLKHAPLNSYDLKMMPYVFYYQISVCDYYNQYFQSNTDNRHIYLDQAVLSTKMMKWFEKHVAELSEALSKI